SALCRRPALLQFLWSHLTMNVKHLERMNDRQRSERGISACQANKKPKAKRCFEFLLRCLDQIECSRPDNRILRRADQHRMISCVEINRVPFLHRKEKL